ncbi:translation initiation factor [Hydrogenimonas thermophila]|uniref:Translation initiation factor 1 (eIF-1/SUI1) n=1 Tax=Hydrogenimonas thermophila TaxID=223786 RepID=A0A1I5PM75_9BACT|nr:translation initiation factor [Hydrogenimonas thermophila]SFP34641.1 translation initiation factor 1 (eIF-1/SUI1) [Hydrogenimonas thermophila]
MARGTKLDLSFGSFGNGWEVDDLCPKCGENRSECICNNEKKILTPAEHRLVFKREKRRGKPVTLVGEFFIDKDEIKSLLKSIKKSLGSGGTFKDGWMELQGEKADVVRPLLQNAGYRFKK